MSLAKTYRKYTDVELAPGLNAMKNGMSYRKAAKMFGLSPSVLYRHFKYAQTIKKQGGQTAISEEEENILVERILVCSKRGYQMDVSDLRLLIKGYLDRKGKTVQKFNKNIPGMNFINSFLKRHKEKLSPGLCQNIKCARTFISAEVVHNYFDHLKLSLKGILPANIVNYNESDLTNGFGQKKITIKRDTKYPENVMNSRKSAISLMFAAAGDGTILPLYTVYKALHMYESWQIDGPEGSRFNCRKSGWFDAECFDDWVSTIAIPYFSKFPPEDKKILIGNNLSSYLSSGTILECKKHNISFVFLPADSTHMTQPLDVAFYATLKIHWSQILTSWKQGEGRNEWSVPNDKFPKLLKQLMVKLSVNGPESARSGFRKCGLIPLNCDQVLKTLPIEPKENSGESSIVDAFLLMNTPKTMRGNNNELFQTKWANLNVEAGISVETLDSNENEDDVMKSCSEDKDSSSNEDVTIQPAAMKVIYPSSSSQDEAIQLVNKSTKMHCFDRMIEVLDWILVSFDVKTNSVSTSEGPKKTHHIGKVVNIEKDGELLFYETMFLCRTKNEYQAIVYEFPDVPDIRLVEQNQVITKLYATNTLRRGIVMFNIDTNLM